MNLSRDLLLKESLHSLVFLNPSAVLPGHCLVLPKKPISSITELLPEEHQDLWLQVQSLSSLIKRFFSSPAFTIELKDQVHPSLYINVIPRFPNDLASNDLIYPMLESMRIQPANEDLNETAENLRKALSN